MSNQPAHIDMDVNGVRLRCHDWGGSGEPILLTHGTGMHASLLGSIATALTAIGQVFSYDRRGHGDSSHDPDAQYNWEVEVEDLAGVIARLGLGKVRALGHSAGATVIGSLAAVEPGRFARVMLVEPVLIESGQSPRASSSDMLERTRRRRRVFDSPAAMFANFENKPPFDTWRREILREYCATGASANAQGEWELKCPPEIEARFYETAMAFDGLARLLKCEVPMMVLFGTRDEESTGARYAKRLRAELKKARILSIPDTGHFLPLEQPGTVARLALEFFAE
ncbi:MAG TPA: alpha/beta hydrolase [Candidatus Binataceae bacterium]|nr:alpha/beta hydrolase [Candidatus Binataceae bacterium]